MLGWRPGACILKGPRAEGSTGWTWVRLVGESSGNGVDRLRLRVRMTLLGRLCDVFCDRSLFLSQHNSPWPCVKQDVIFMLHARCQYNTFYQINVYIYI